MEEYGGGGGRHSGEKRLQLARMAAQSCLCKCALIETEVVSPGCGEFHQILMDDVVESKEEAAQACVTLHQSIGP